MTEKQIMAKLRLYQRYADKESDNAEANKHCLLAWQAAEQRRCFWLGEIKKLEESLALIRAGWGSIIA